MIEDSDERRVRQVARALHPHLPVDGGEWELTHIPSNRRPQFRRDEFGFYLRPAQEAGRMVISASFPETIRREFDGYQQRWPEITVSVVKAPELIVRDLQRRWLPEAERLFAQLLERARNKNAREFAKDEACKRLQAASGSRELWHEASARGYGKGSRDHRVGSRGKDFECGGAYDVHAEVAHNTVDGRLTVSMNLTLGVDDACAVLRLLAARHDGEEFGGTETDD
jgi:hypothetical protein